ncbi:MAG: aminotransferase class I/II-fold pyridoxal phosphate-dependent enzyme [Alphaproteobacteria bacterium]|nr:aminotransferase class I/II-fold pyridoxal phosphate-dependent enzyme [Alphaproteobacteria bacterium]
MGTKAIHAGQEPEPVTGAVMTPVFQTSTYAQPAPAEWPWEYSRTHNPTRTALQACIAGLEGGTHGLSFSSGMAAIDTMARTLKPGDRVVCGDDVYGGTYRLFTKVVAPMGVHFDFVDLSDPAAEIPVGTTMVWCESPTNPLLKVTDLSGLVTKAKAAGARVVVDNTFATPVYQRPLELGADAVVHSTTKYLNGHSDVVGGVIVTSDDALAEQLAFLQNSVGAVPGPWDCFLTLRGLKTLKVRMDRHTANASEIAAWLASRDDVAKVRYPGFSGMVSFDLAGDLAAARRFVMATRLFTLAESLGGVESLIELPAIMTHASVPPEIRADIGIADGLIRLSCGIEDLADLKADLEQAFRAAQG